MTLPGDFRGRINGWICDHCGLPTYAVHVDHGVTPMLLACRASGRLNDCPGMAVSMGYPAPKPPADVVHNTLWEWYRPAEIELAKMSTGMQDHVRNGGLAIREITEAGRKAFVVRYGD